MIYLPHNVIQLILKFRRKLIFEDRLIKLEQCRNDMILRMMSYHFYFHEIKFFKTLYYISFLENNFILRPLDESKRINKCFFYKKHFKW